MARFVFKLAPLHRVKRQMEDLAKDKLSQEMAELRRRLAALEESVALEEAALDAFRRDAGGRFVVHRIRSRNAQLSVAHRRVEARGEQARESEESTEAARLELVHASQERKMFDKLRDDAFGRYMSDERHAEQMAADETVSYKVGVALAADPEEPQRPQP